MPFYRGTSSLKGTFCHTKETILGLQILGTYFIFQMFRMAARNIKDNTSESVSEEQIKVVLRRSLDEVLTV